MNLEGFSEGLNSHLLLNAGTAISLDEIAHGFIWVGLEILQMWGFHNLSDQPIPLLA